MVMMVVSGAPRLVLVLRVRVTAAVMCGARRSSRVATRAWGRRVAAVLFGVVMRARLRHLMEELGQVPKLAPLPGMCAPPAMVHALPSTRVLSDLGLRVVVRRRGRVMGLVSFLSSAFRSFGRHGDVLLFSLGFSSPDGSADRSRIARSTTALFDDARDARVPPGLRRSSRHQRAPFPFAFAWAAALAASSGVAFFACSSAWLMSSMSASFWSSVRKGRSFCI